MKHIVAILILGAGLSACSFYLVKHDAAVISVDSAIESESELEAIIKPYRNEMAEQMDEVIGFNEHFMSKARPCSPIHNWVADAVLTEATKTVRLSEAVMVLLNHGGIRAALPEGDLTVGNIYELMPFDNRLVWLRMPMNYLDTIEQYLINSGGEPISGVRMTKKELEFVADFNGSNFWVLTSDYLANGGDNMAFFQAAIERNDTPQLLRDVFMNAVRNQDTLRVDQTCRIDLN